MLQLIAPILLAGLANAQANAPGVVASYPNGDTNPPEPEFYPIGAQVNQTSYSRLLTLNSVDDFCLFAPPDAGANSTIGETEAIEVAWCTKPRNGARLIPDGTIKAAHFIKTDAYVQIYGTWDGTKVNIPAGDSGGELDPHGATNLGNPVGGNVTSNVSGQDIFYEEWMSFVSDTTFCLRICTAVVNGVSAADMCEHKLDEMGCAWVMAIQNDGLAGFDSCAGDVAVAPGRYPLPGGGTSTFAQRWTGTENGQAYTIGVTVTPAAPYTIPATSNCQTYSTISNGVNPNNLMVTAAPSLFVGGSVSVGSTSQADITSVSVAPSSSATTTDSPASTGGANPQGGAGASGATDSSSGTTAPTDKPKSAAGRAATAGSFAPVAVGAVVGAMLIGAAAVF